jgi:hypothetical protein
MFSIGRLEHKNEYGFRQENSPFKKKHLKFPKISLFIFTHTVELGYNEHSRDFRICSLYPIVRSNRTSSLFIKKDK